MDYPNIRANLHSIYYAKSICSMFKRNFKYTAVNTFERFGVVRLTTLCGNC